MNKEEIFTIGDKTNNGTIKSFELINNQIRVYFNEKPDNYHVNLNTLTKIKQPLFTTEDGVDIFVGYDYYALITPDFHNKPCIWNILPSTARKNILYDQEGNRKNGRLWFSTKDAAEKYILFNKPCLSLKDISNISFDMWDEKNKTLQELKKLVKLRLL